MLQQFTFDRKSTDRLAWDRMSRHRLARHERIVGLLSGILGKAMGLGVDECKLLTRAAALHDIGKADIDPSIWNKAGPLDADETSLAHQHTVLGYLRLKSRPQSANLNLAAVIALEHHERWDGQGYPAGKKGLEISLPARITSICDVYAALRERRSYKACFEHEAALAELEAGSGSQFDPSVFAAFLVCEPEIKKAFESSS